MPTHRPGRSSRPCSPRCLAAAAKVAPGIPHELVPAGIEIEWVSVGGGLKEAVLWAGSLTDGETRRRATLLPSGATMQSKSDVDGPAPTGAMRRYLYEPDDAVVRAHLVGDLAGSIDGVLLDATTAYLTSDRLVDTPFAHAFEVSEVMPFSLKRLRSALRERDVGGVTIMKRGSAVDVEQLRRDLRLKGTRQAVVVLALIDGKHHAVIADAAKRERSGLHGGLAVHPAGSVDDGLRTKRDADLARLVDQLDSRAHARRGCAETPHSRGSPDAR